MIKRTEKLVITFHTTTAAMAMEQRCREDGLEGRLIPVPGTISAGCGLAWCAGLAAEAALRDCMDAHSIEFQGIYHCLI